MEVFWTRNSLRNIKMISLVHFIRVVMILIIISVQIGVIDALSTRSSSSSSSYRTGSTTSSSSSILRYHILKRTVQLRKQLLLVYYRNDKTQMTDEFMSVQNVPLTPKKATSTVSSIPTSSTSSSTTIVPSRIDSTTIAKVVLSHAGTIVLSTFAFVLMFGIITTMTTSTDIVGDTSSMNSMELAFPPPPSSHWLTILCLGCGGGFPLIHTSHATNHRTAFGLRTSNSINRNAPYTETTIRSVGYRNQMEVTQMVMQMLGRRRQEQQEQLDTNRDHYEWNNTTTSSTTASSVIILSLINSMTAISSELLYRLYLPTLLHSLTSDYTMAIMVPAILYGVSHTQWNNNNPCTTTAATNMVDPNPAVNVDTFMLFMHQALASIWYSMLYMCSGSIVPCIISHYMYDMDLLTSTWHSVNNQMDYIDKNIIDTHTSFESEMTLTTKAQQPQNDHPSESMLTTEAEDTSRRFFLAFDSEHVGSWNEYDFERALQYILYHNNNNNNDISRSRRTRDSTIGSFHQFATMTQSSSTSSLLYVPRVQYKEYVQLLEYIYKCTDTIKQTLTIS